MASTNFIQKPIDPAAAAMSGRGPSNRRWSPTLPTKPIASDRRDPPAEPDRFRNGIGGKRGDEFGGFHSIDLRACRS
jgi:hypothetical protein